MPLIKSGSRAAVGRNFAELQRSGRPRAQSIAIALDTQRRARRADGGVVGQPDYWGWQQEVATPRAQQPQQPFGSPLGWTVPPAGGLEFGDTMPNGMGPNSFRAMPGAAPFTAPPPFQGSFLPPNYSMAPAPAPLQVPAFGAGVGPQMPMLPSQAAPQAQEALDSAPAFGGTVSGGMPFTPPPAATPEFGGPGYAGPPTATAPASEFGGGAPAASAFAPAPTQPAPAPASSGSPAMPNGGVFEVNGQKYWLGGAGVNWTNPNPQPPGTIAIASMSDRRTKQNAKPIGKTFDGQTIHKFQYKHDPGRTHVGLMAQEVEKRNPGAVHHDRSGTKYVDYDAATRGAERRGGVIPPGRARGGVIAPEMPWHVRTQAHQLDNVGHAGPLSGRTGPLLGLGGGRTDSIPANVPSGSYVVPADIPSALGQGNSLNGMKVLDGMFGTGPYGMKASKPRVGRSTIPRAPRPARAIGGPVPIMAADGEYIIDPEKVAEIGQGDLQAGHAALDKWVIETRKEHAATLKSLPRPAR